jgi:hypothetical protein
MAPKTPWAGFTSASNFFRSQGTPPAQRVWTAAFYLKGAASQWYFRLEKNQGELSWPDFVDGVNKRFNPPTRSNPLGELMHLRCSGTVDEFQENFLTLLARYDNINEKQQIAIFSAGLPPRWALTLTYISLLLLMMPCPGTGFRAPPGASRRPTSHHAAHARRHIPQGPLLRPPNDLRRQPARAVP